MKTYDELMTFTTFLDRYKYLKLNGIVGKATFGFDRWLNQKFYRSPEWKQVRRDVILRDCGCDLACSGHELDKAYVHHMNPIMSDDLVTRSDIVFNPNYLITVSFETHQAIHFGDESLLLLPTTERKPNDTCPWRI